MARIKLATKVVSEDAKTVTFNFNGAGEVVVATADMPKDIQRRLLAHGLSQKLGDAYAKKGIDTPAAAMEEVQTVIAMLADGQWAQKREGGGGVAGGQTVTALHRIGERDPESMSTFMGGIEITKDNVRTWFVAQSDEAKKAMTGSPQIANEIADMKREAASDNTDLFAIPTS